MTCQARPTRDGHACAACGTRWDRDDQAPPCPVMQRAEAAAKTVAGWTPAKQDYSKRATRYVSALAPDRFK